jgi:hypothetical protein
VEEYKTINHQILNNMFDFFIAKFKQNECKSNYIYDVCKARRTEGYMINSSLASVRKMFSRLLKERTKTNLLINPPHFEECDDQYINKLGELFKFANNDNGNTNDTIGLIFKTIQTELDDPTTTTSISKINELIISVFCVLNVSRNANNPPPVPYINLNELRQKYKEAYRLFVLGKSGKFKVVSSTSNSSNQSPDESLYIKCYDLLISSYKMSYFYRLFSSDEYKYDYEGKSTPISTLLHSILIDDGIGTPYSDLMRIIENFITFIDNNNQVSAIGTLEFVDRLSKLNTVDTLCRFEPTKPNTLNYEYTMESSQTQTIIPKTSGGGEIGHKTTRFRTSFRRRSERNKR